MSSMFEQEPSPIKSESCLSVTSKASVDNDFKHKEIMGCKCSFDETKSWITSYDGHFMDIWLLKMEIQEELKRQLGSTDHFSKEESSFYIQMKISIENNAIN